MPRGFTRRDVLPGLLALTALVVGALLFGFFMVPHSVQVNFDEGAEAAGVDRLISGRWLPYVDIASMRGPFLYWCWGIFEVIGGKFEFTGTRLFALASALATVLATFLAGWAAGWPLAGAIGSAFYIFSIAIVTLPGGGIGVVGESLAVAFVAAALALVAYGLERARSERGKAAFLAGGGAVIGMAALTKQTTGIASFSLLLWIAIHAATEGRTRALVVKRVLPFVAGGVGLFALVVLRYAIAGELETFFFWTIKFGAKYYMAPFHGHVLKGMSDWFIEQPWAILGVTFALVTSVARPLAFVEGPSGRAVLAGMRRSGFELTVGLTAIALLVGAAMPLRIWPHYFMTIYPFFGLVIGILIERIVQRGSTVPWLGQLGAVAVVGGLLIAGGANRLHTFQQQRVEGGWGSPRPDPVCTEIDRIAGPGHEGMFVWGTAGDLYITCRRPSVSRFTATMVLAGLVPPDWTPTPSRVAPGIQELVLRELVEARPVVVLDHAMAPGATMMDIPMYADFVKRGYCRLSTVTSLRGNGMTIYGRRDLAACQGRN